MGRRRGRRRQGGARLRRPRHGALDRARGRALRRRRGELRRPRPAAASRCSRRPRAPRAASPSRLGTPSWSWSAGRAARSSPSTCASSRTPPPIAGRAPGSVKTTALVDVIVGATREEAEAKAAEYDSFVTLEGALTFAESELNPEEHDDDVTVAELVEAGALPPTDGALRYAGGQTIGQVKETFRFLRLAHRAIGTPAEVADQIESWLDDDGLDAINLRQWHTFGTLTDFVELVVPELQRRGRFRTAYEPGETLRERLFDAGPWVDRPPPRAALPQPAFRRSPLKGPPTDAPPPLQRLLDELRLPHPPRPVGARGLAQHGLHRPRRLDRARRSCSSAASSTRSSSPTSSAPTPPTAATATRRSKRACRRRSTTPRC